MVCKSVYAEPGEGLKIGDATVKASVSVEETYDDNVFLNKDGAKHDFINTDDIQFLFETPFAADHFFKVDYLCEVANYAKYSSQNSVNNYVGAKAEFNFNAFNADAEARYENFFDRDASEYTTRIPRERMIFGGILSKEFERLDAELAYKATKDNYLSHDVIDNSANVIRYYFDEDRWNQQVSLTGLCRIAPHTKALGEFDYGIIDYDTGVNPGSNMYQYLVGIRRAEDEDMGLDVMLRAGYRQQLYKDAQDKNYDGFVVYLDLKEAFNAYTSVALRLSQAIDESTYSNNNYYVYDIIGLKYDHRLRANTKVSLFFDGYFQQSRYPQYSTEAGQTAKRRDNIWNASVGLKYDIRKWLSANFKYYYKNRHSNLDSLDYDDNAVTAGVKLSY